MLAIKYPLRSSSDALVSFNFCWIVLQRPGWASPRDREIVAAKLQIENAISVRNERELYSPLFRNVSMFKRLELIYLYTRL